MACFYAKVCCTFVLLGARKHVWELGPTVVGPNLAFGLGKRVPKVSAGPSPTRCRSYSRSSSSSFCFLILFVLLFAVFLLLLLLSSCAPDCSSDLSCVPKVLASSKAQIGSLWIDPYSLLSNVQNPVRGWLVRGQSHIGWWSKDNDMTHGGTTVWANQSETPGAFQSRKTQDLKLNVKAEKYMV